MHDSTIVLIVIVALIAAIAIGVLTSRRTKGRSARLRERFGPEYDRALERHGNREIAERELLARAQRMEHINLVPLTPEAHDRFVLAWAETQRQFVDDPIGAVGRADKLINDVMQARGYPMVDFEQRVADISVHHADVAQHYRAARSLALASTEGRATTEDLRQAFVHYRALFADLLETAGAVQERSRRPGFIRKEAHG